MIFFFLKRTQKEALLCAIRRLTSHVKSLPDDVDDDDDDDASESMFDMECQHISTHVAGYPQATEMDVCESQTRGTSERLSPVFGGDTSPVFGRRGIHDVKPTAGLEALHEYDGCDQDDEPEETLPLNSSDDQIEEIIVPVGFNSPVIKYVNHMLSCHCLCMMAIHCSVGVGNGNGVES